MVFPPYQLELLVNEAVGCAATDSLDANRTRRDVRYPTRQRIKLYRQRGEQPPQPIGDAILTDLSNSGAQLIAPRAFSVGRTLLLELRPPTRPSQPGVLAPLLIRRQARLVPHAYEVGGEFLFHLGGTLLSPPDPSCPSQQTGRCPHCDQPIEVSNASTPAALTP